MTAAAAQDEDDDQNRAETVVAEQPTEIDTHCSDLHLLCYSFLEPGPGLAHQARPVTDSVPLSDDRALRLWPKTTLGEVQPPTRATNAWYFR